VSGKKRTPPQANRALQRGSYVKRGELKGEAMHWSQPAWDEEGETVLEKNAVRSHTSTLVRSTTMLVLGGEQAEDKFTHASLDTGTEDAPKKRFTCDPLDEALLKLPH
jgi:hypothetical protein